MFIKELCDPKNPIYIEKVAEYMQDTIAIENVQEDITNLENKQRKLQHEVSMVEEEFQENKTESEKELSDLKSEIDTKKSELSALTSKLRALSGIESMKLLEELFTWTKMRIRDFSDQVPIFADIRVLPLKTADFKWFKEIIDDLKELMDKNELVPKELLDEARLKHEKEMQELLLKTTYAMDHNVLKLHEKVREDIQYIFKQIDEKTSIPDRTSVNAISEYMSRAIKRLEKWDADVPNTVALLKGD